MSKLTSSAVTLARLETKSNAQAVEIIKTTLANLTSDEQMDEFLDAYQTELEKSGEPDVKNYKSRVKAILKNWKDHDKRAAIIEHETKSVQILAKYARSLNKKAEGEEGDDQTKPSKVEKTMSIGDISAILDRCAADLAKLGRMEHSQKLSVLSAEILEEMMSPATM